MAASVDPGDRRDPAMLIGILSDSHGRVETTRAAVAALRERGAEMLPRESCSATAIGTSRV